MAAQECVRDGEADHSGNAHQGCVDKPANGQRIDPLLDLG